MTIGWAILSLMRMVARRRSTDGMLGCLIFSVQPNATFDFVLATAGLVATLATAALGQP